MALELARLADLAPDAVLESGELKGGRVADTELLKQVGKRLRERRVLFWATWMPAAGLAGLDGTRRRFEAWLGHRQPDPFRLDRDEVSKWYRKSAECYSSLKPTSQHVLMSTVLHLQWLAAEIGHRKLGSFLGSARVVIDRENYKEPAQCAKYLKDFVCAGLQQHGMDCRLTGRFREQHDEGAVTVDANADSAEHVGIQLVDALLQVVRRQLPKPESAANQ